MDSVVDVYLRALVAHDWDALRATLVDEGLTRIGPFCDRIDGTEPYVEYLKATMPMLERYELRVQRSSTVDNRTFVELTETLDVGGKLVTYPECLLFELDESGRIQHVRVFIMTPPG